MSFTAFSCAWSRANGLYVVNAGKYRLGAGGRGGTTALTPFNKDGECDCSGFTAWVWGLDRFQKGSKHDFPGMAYDAKNGGVWLDTNNIIRDATGKGGRVFFRHVPKSEDVWVGDLVVYGDKDGKQGHVGFIAAVLPGFKEARAAGKGWGARLFVIDCSPTRANRPFAVQYRPDGGRVFEASGRAYFVRPAWRKV